MIRTIGVGLYGTMCGHGGGGHGKMVPGCLCITSAEIKVLQGEPVIAGFCNHVLTASSEGDYLRVSSDGNPIVEDDVEMVRITGKKENTITAVDFVTSKKAFYGDFSSDGILLRYSAEAWFGLERVNI